MNKDLLYLWVKGIWYKVEWYLMSELVIYVDLDGY